MFHEYAFFAAATAGAGLIAVASSGRERFAASVFATAVAVMFGVSALFHRVTWGPRARRLMGQLDAAAIYLLIAATYTPFALLVLSGRWQVWMLAVAWGGAAVAVLLKLVWPDEPKWLAAAIAVVLGWLGVVMLPQLLEETGPVGLALLAAGGLLYTAGAVVYARRKPDPVPAVFGYHELFHALVVAAAACQYVAIAFLVAG